MLQRTAFFVLAGVALAAAGADSTGEPAEGGVRGMPGVTRAAIHEDEEMAEIAFYAAVALGLVALGLVAVGTLVRLRRTPIPGSAALVTLGGTFAVAGLMAYTGLLGGRIRYTEVRGRDRHGRDRDRAALRPVGHRGAVRSTARLGPARLAPTAIGSSHARIGRTPS